jgi:hypothetical protein
MFWLTGDVLIPVVVQGPQEAGFKYKEHNPEAAKSRRENRALAASIIPKRTKDCCQIDESN